MVLLTTYGCDGEEQMRRQFETGKCSAACASDVLNVKIKRRKVSAIRDFPKGFEQLGAQSTWIQDKPLDSVGTIGNLLGKKDSADYSEDEFVDPFENDVGSQKISVHSETHGLSNNLESTMERMVGSNPREFLELDVELPNALGDAKLINPQTILEHESIGIVASMKSMDGSEVKIVLGDEAQAQEMDGSSALKMRSGALPRINLPQRSVSVIRCFPPGCGRNAVHLSREDYLKASDSSYNKGFSFESKNYEEKVQMKSIGDATNTIMKTIPFDSAQDFVAPFENDVGSQQNSVHLEMDGLSNIVESTVERIVGYDSKEDLELDVELPKILEDSKLINPLKILERESIGLIDSMKSMDRSEVKIAVVDEAQAQEMDGSSSLKMRPGTLPIMNLPQRRVSVIRDFPPGCGIQAAHLTKEDYLKALASSFYNKGLGHKSKNYDKVQLKSEGDATHTIMKTIQFAKSSKIKLEGIETSDKCVKSICTSSLCQSNLKSKEVVRKEDDDFGVSELKQGKDSLTVVEDSDRNLSGVSAHRNQLQVEHPVSSEHPAGRVVVQALMAGPRCPWRQGKRAFKSSSTSVIVIGKGQKALT